MNVTVCSDGYVSMHQMTRAEFDAFPGIEEKLLHISECWAKHFESGSFKERNYVRFDFFTNEPPIAVETETPTVATETEKEVQSA